jgi:DDE superfamily endonuclease
VAEAGWCGLYYLDERGVAPTLPTGSTWARAGTRARVRDEPPRGRRLTVLGALAPDGEAARLVWGCPAGKVDSATPLGVIRRDVAGLPVPSAGGPAGERRERPCVVGLGNASAHTSKAVAAARPDLEAAHVRLDDLPPSSPDLNRIEARWRQVKHQDLPVRSHRTLDDLRAAVEGALRTHADRLLDATANLSEAA